jgi:hypothetical protein
MPGVTMTEALGHSWDNIHLYTQEVSQLCEGGEKVMSGYVHRLGQLRHLAMDERGPTYPPLSKFRVKINNKAENNPHINFLLVFPTEAEHNNPPNQTQTTITKSDQEKAVENGECCCYLESQLLLSILICHFSLSYTLRVPF